MKTKGFTVLFATLVASLLLAVGLAIFDIIFKEVSLAIVARDSNYAIYAADTGAECARYWDTQCPSSICTNGPSAFPTSTISSQVPANSGLQCAGQDISTLWGSPQLGAYSATTTFQISLSPSGQPPYCTVVQVIKSSIVGTAQTSIIASGFNTCDATNPNRIERTYLITY